MTPPLGASTAAAARAPRGRPAGGPAPAAQVGWTQAAIRADIADVRRRCAELGRGDELAALQRPRPGAIFGPAAASWLAVFSAWWCVAAVSPALWPLALVVVASRQRALGNALHDAAHGNGVRSTRLNQWLLAVPMFEDFEHYRRDHLLHHAHLGDAALDPDYLAPIEGAPPSASVLYARAALAPRRWRESALGQLPGLSWAARGRAALWWACLLSGVAGLGAALGLGASAAATFAGLWLLARASTYHLLKVFTELSDHAGLEPGSILSNTRNSPANWLSALLHPHADNYHLAHHLAPRVPTWRLPALHALLLGVEAYRAGHHCDGYFLGRSSVVRGWCRAGGADATAGRAPPPAASAPHAPKGGGA